MNLVRRGRLGIQNDQVDLTPILLSIPLTVITVSGLQLVSPVAFLLIFAEASLLMGSALRLLTKTTNFTAPLVIGTSLVLIIVGGVLAPFGQLTSMATLVLLDIVVITLSLLGVNLPVPDVRPRHVWILLSATAGLIVALWFRVHSPYPLEVDTDVIKTIIRANYVARTGFSPLILMSGLRPSMFEIGVATLSIVTSLKPSMIVWCGPFVTYPLFSTGVLLLAFRFTRNWVIAFLSSLLYLFVCGFWTLSGPQLILPATFVGFLNIYLVILYLDWNPTGFKPFLYFVPLVLLCDFAYFYAVAYILPLFAVLQVWPVRRLGRIGIFALCEITILGLFAALSLYAATLGSQEALPAQYLSFDQSVLLAAYSPATIALILVGVFFALVAKKRDLYPVVMYGLLLLSVYFSPIPFGNRSETMARPELAIIAGIGIGAIGSVTHISRGGRHRSAIVSGVLFLIAFPLIAMPYQNWYNQSVPVQGWNGLPLNQFNTDEANAGLWLLANSKSGYVVSDIESSAIMQSLSSLPGLWNPIYFLNNATVIGMVYSALSATNYTDAFNIMKGVSGNYANFYFVITSRTTDSIGTWENEGKQLSQANVESLLVYYPEASPAHVHLSVEGVSPVYSNPTVSIYDVKA